MWAAVKKSVFLLVLALFFANTFWTTGCAPQHAEQTLPVVVTDPADNRSPNIKKSSANKSNSNQPGILKTNLDTSEFAAAAKQNAVLKQNLEWAFGGKQQKGWYIYQPLICQTIGIELSANDMAFAAALSRWQKNIGLPPNGILDEASLAAMVTKWQSNRLKNRADALPDELLMGLPADFYDPSRAPELRMVAGDAYAAYKKMVAVALADKYLKLAGNGKGELASSEKFLKIISSYRSREYQEKLRAASPDSGRAGLAVNSPHFTGRALDIYVGGEPVSTKDENRWIQVNTPVYQWLVKNAGKFGFKPYFYEPWHWEYSPE